MTKLFTLCTGVTTRRLGLLFNTQDTTAVVNDPAIKTFFPKGFFAIQVTNESPRRHGWFKGSYNIRNKGTKRVFISEDIEYPLPDAAKLDDPPIGYYRDGRLNLINQRTRYNSCYSLLKAVGCGNCPDRGATCFSEAIEQQVGPTPATDTTPPTEDALDFDDAIALLKKNKLVIAGHAFVEPTKTRVAEFSAASRPYWEHDFSQVEQNTKDMSERAVNAAKTRRFSKQHCKVCPLDKGCERARHCTTRYEPEPVLVKHGVESIKKAVENSHLKPWQIWTLNEKEGTTSKHSRWQIVLAGVALSNDVFVPSVYRSKTNINQYLKLKTYEEIADVFDLPKREEDARYKDSHHIPDEMLGLWWQVLKLHGHSSRGYSLKFLLGSSVEPTGIAIQWAKNRYLTWRDHVKNFYQVSSKIYYGRLPDAPYVDIVRE